LVADAKTKVKAKYTLSDGVASIVAIITESTFDKFVSIICSKFIILMSVGVKTKFV